MPISIYDGGSCSCGSDVYCYNVIFLSNGMKKMVAYLNFLSAEVFSSNNIFVTSSWLFSYEAYAEAFIVRLGVYGRRKIMIFIGKMHGLDQ